MQALERIELRPSLLPLAQDLRRAGRLRRRRQLQLQRVQARQRVQQLLEQIRGRNGEKVVVTESARLLCDEAQEAKVGRKITASPAQPSRSGRERAMG